jgi:PIN domain nuclease of toxin-antitoxin system
LCGISRQIVLSRLAQLSNDLVIPSRPSAHSLASPATYWKVAIKISLKKLDLHSPYEEFMKKGIDCKLLWATIIAGTEIQPDDSCGGLDHHPFDRLLHGLGTTS